MTGPGPEVAAERGFDAGFPSTPKDEGDKVSSSKLKSQTFLG